jgi:hypothetical protein
VSPLPEVVEIINAEVAAVVQLGQGLALIHKEGKGKREGTCHPEVAHRAELPEKSKENHWFYFKPDQWYPHRSRTGTPTGG